MLQIVKLNERATVPTRAHYGDLGYDLYCLDQVTIVPGVPQVISTGIACKFPAHYGAIIHDRSSLASRGLKVAGGVIDHAYTGEIKVVMNNLNSQIKWQLPWDLNPHGTGHWVDPQASITLEAGSKIAQMVLMPVLADRHAIAVIPQLDTELERPIHCPFCKKIFVAWDQNEVLYCYNCNRPAQDGVQVFWPISKNKRETGGFGSTGA